MNAERFAEQYVQSRATRGFGPLRILQELLERGVERPLAEQAIRTWSGDWDLHLIEVYRKRYGVSAASSQAERAKRLRFLRQRGFSTSGIDKLVFASDPMNRA